jgi:hypothetical protein
VTKTRYNEDKQNTATQNNAHAHAHARTHLFLGLLEVQPCDGNSTGVEGITSTTNQVNSLANIIGGTSIKSTSFLVAREEVVDNTGFGPERDTTHVVVKRKGRYAVTTVVELVAKDAFLVVVSLVVGFLVEGTAFSGVE